MSIPKINIIISNGCNTCGQSLILAPEEGGCGCTQAVVVTEDDTPNSPCVNCDSECVDIWPTDCVLYSVADIPQLGISKSDKLTKIIIILSAEIIELKRRLAVAAIP